MQKRADGSPPLGTGWLPWWGASMTSRLLSRGAKSAYTFAITLGPASPGNSEESSCDSRTRDKSLLTARIRTDTNQVGRALRVFERLIQSFEPQYTSKLLNSLGRDGYTVDEETGHIASGGPRFAPSSLQNITDASAIRQQLTRIQHAVLDDPALAVGSAKELYREHGQSRAQGTRPASR